MFYIINAVFISTLCLLSTTSGTEADLPTLYGHYTEGGISSGLATYPEGFLLNGKNITLISGALHYFRVHPEYWRDRLRKLRAAGFVAVETIIPWNLHEPRSGEYDFGDGDNDLSMFTDFTKFFKIAQEEDLLAIVRPGPWTAGEWEGGGLPSWLYRDRNMVVRHSNRPFMNFVNRYYDKLFPILHDLQFTKGGPIIGFQIENEYGLYVKGMPDKDTAYLEEVRQNMLKHNLTEFKFTMDAPFDTYRNGSIPGVLMTANFISDPVRQLTELKKLQPDQPLWVLESYPGYFDSWFDTYHSSLTVEDHINNTRLILDMGASINIYMFHGGTTFGFMNGGVPNNVTPTYMFHVSSYDYGAPLTEAGDYGDKYDPTAELVKDYVAVQTRLPERPPESVKEVYGSIPCTAQLSVGQLIDQVAREDRVHSEYVVSMEEMDINNGSGQSYGFIVYRKAALQIPNDSVLKIWAHVYDMAVVLVDGVPKTKPVTSVNQVKEFGCWESRDGELKLDDASSGANKTLDIIVENMGRWLFRKGLFEAEVYFNGEVITNWEVVALQFHTKWVNSLTGWQNVSQRAGPTMYRAILNVPTPHDTFIDMSRWGKGNVFVNGFNIGRYFSVGPPHTMYVPAPLLKKGANEILVFELYNAAKEIVFTKTPILGPTQ